jgi:hypothetical protein
MTIVPLADGPATASLVRPTLSPSFKVDLRRAQHFAKAVFARMGWSALSTADTLRIGPRRRVVDLDQMAPARDLPRLVELAPAIHTTAALPDIHPTDAPGTSLWGMFEEASKIVTQPACWFVDQNVDVYFPHSVAQSRGRIYKQSMLSEFALFNPKFAYPAETMRFRPYRTREAGILFSMPWHYNFYHWMIDILPRLHVLDIDRRLDHLPILVPASSRGFIRETLKMTPHFNRVRFIEDGMSRFKALHFLAPLSEPCRPSPLAIAWLNRTFDLDALPQRETPQRIFVTRNDALTRYIQNDREIRDIAEQHGYAIVSMTDYSLVEQAQLMRQARVVVGVHGANLTMTAFCKPGTLLAEIFENASGGAVQRSPSFYQMGRLNGLRYGYMAGTKAGNATFVDPRDFDHMLQRIDEVQG